ncbi:MAG: PilN domain-containing protein, partial [Desulfobacterales bacterium]|nr:PilN domain-containing protein [Desulfobacterales bacterium]
SGTVYAETFPGAKQVQAAPLLLMESRVKQAKTRAAGRNGEHERRQVFSVMDILTDLSGQIPAEVDMEISRLALNHGRLVLTGTTGNFNDVDRIKGLLQGAPGFKSVSINSAEADKTGKRVRFKFIVDI